ncbi:D-tyrosyl-tRNA(Tyr) deacylase [Bacillus sp. THAF10]|uniref:D-aminoacyl-tRNA deacylase n=1 Tax=Bacillus sp. THAF10 TaxID=2587848 RepID=UPI001268A208|nr:D-aminoacyl-tRNA deacylase [Bacillus sp. THAF10]QFT90003.1 D-tyrosyl-tRNA(Tyr) deacylase [Bacillus sp. THAF10]
MRVVLQRTKRAEVRVNDEVVGKIDRGVMLLVGVTHEDTHEDAAYVAEKVVNLRIFEDELEKMNLSLLDVEGSVLSVSQFTLYGDCRKGRRPNFMAAAKPDHAEEIYESFNKELRSKGVTVETGTFGAMMDIDFVNDGPVTLLVESK